jgi:hypothetical protein
MVEIHITQLLVEPIHHQLNSAEVIVSDNEGKALTDVPTPTLNCLTRFPNVCFFS